MKPLSGDSSADLTICHHICRLTSTRRQRGVALRLGTGGCGAGIAELGYEGDFQDP